MTERRGVALHVPELNDPDAILRNVANVHRDLGADVELEVVAHGPGLDLVLASAQWAATVGDLIADGVTFDACHNTMQRKGVGADELTTGVQIVPAGLGQLVRLQWQGYAYLRP